MRLRFALLCVASLLGPTLSPCTGVSQDVLQIVKRKEALVKRLAEEAAALFRRRARLTVSCSCSLHVCSTGLTPSACALLVNCDSGSCAKERRRSVPSFVVTPAETDIDAVSEEMASNICLYKNLELRLQELMPRPRTETRISTKDGHSRVYPGAERRERLLEGDDVNSVCSNEDPRRSAAYVGASVGPKDVVFVLDSTEDMAKRWKGQTRLDVIRAGVPSVLETLSSMDRVNFVAVTDKARRRGTQAALYSGSPTNLDQLETAVRALYPEGRCDVRAGVELGMDLLINSSRRRRRRGAFHEGQKVLVVVAGTRLNVRNATSPRAAFLRRLDRLQRQLQDISGVRATIFSYAIGQDVDAPFLKQLACANGGAWFEIDPKGDAVEALHSYNTFLASTHAASAPIWTNFRQDPYGPGVVTSVAKAFHFRPGHGTNALLLGVVSHDVHFAEVRSENREVVEKVLMRRSRQHDALDASACQLQVFRNVFANGAICVDALPTRRPKRRRKSESPPPCFVWGEDWYRIQSDRATWEEAAENCSTDGGVLATARSSEELAFLAGMAEEDGSWIGASGSDQAARFRWLHDDGLDVLLANLGDGRNASCLSLDNGGPDNNFTPRPCATQQSYLCRYASKKPCTDVIALPQRGYFAVPPLDMCIEEEEALANTGAVSSSTLLPSSHLWCSLEDEPRDLQSLCCQRCRSRAKNAG